VSAPFAGVAAQVLAEVAEALATGRLTWPASALSLRARGLDASAEALLPGLADLAARFPASADAAAVLGMVAAERAAHEQADERRLDLVWSGPEAAAESRDTAVVVRELFADARKKVLLSTYNLGAPAVLAPLMERKRQNPQLEVRMFVQISEHLMHGLALPGEEPVTTFRRTFASRWWPRAPLPEVFYDPRALAAGKAVHLHAKCVVVDEEVAFVTSANFSEAAQTDNIEAGVVVRDARFARALAGQFEGLVARGALMRAI
jgi:phosphatidylserine/phosphatidylglycerophosphate/cardiolipin synthase-like enzyme